MLFSFQFQSSVLNFYFPNEFPEQVTKNETLFQDLVGTFTFRVFFSFTFLYILCVESSAEQRGDADTVLRSTSSAILFDQNLV